MYQNKIPYVSIAFANRNDNYGGDLDNRINRFIDYYADYVSKYPDLFEFVICDWNPPRDSHLLKDSYPWHKLGNVQHHIVSPEIHDQYAQGSNKPMLDYIARNVAIRNSNAPFSLIINQDIFLSPSILEFIAKRKLDHNSFYRTDRLDFDFEKINNTPPRTSDIIEEAQKSSFAIHRRHSSTKDDITILLNFTNHQAEATQMEPGDKLDEEYNIISCLAAENLRHKILSKGGGASQNMQKLYRSPYLHQAFFLHTNASGDFILAAKSAFEKINGLVETVDFYMHSDSYAIVQLFAAGYMQKIFAYPHCVYHADHVRSASEGVHESLDFEQHQKIFSAILRHDKSYKLNDENWGLHKYSTINSS